MTPVMVKTVKTQSQIEHFSFRKIQASREVKTGLLRDQWGGGGNKKNISVAALLKRKRFVFDEALQNDQQRLQKMDGPACCNS